ncbi:hypothetical protein KC929_00250 [Patescibacteria group bacterium]|nr:hypothetical protein [Patescibacteria group bacterium]
MIISKQQGSLKWIIIIIVALVLASYFFDFSVQNAVEDEQTQSNFNYVKTHVVGFYNAYLRNTAEYLWNDVIVDLLWESFIENLERIKEGQPTVFEDAAPGVAAP